MFKQTSSTFHVPLNDPWKNDILRIKVEEEEGIFWHGPPSSGFFEILPLNFQGPSFFFKPFSFSLCYLQMKREKVRGKKMKKKTLKKYDKKW